MATPPPTDPITTPMTYAQLQAEAQQQAQSEVQGQNAPLIAQEGTLQGQQTHAEQNIATEFNQLLPYVQSSAERVAATEKSAMALEQSVFQAAGTRMNQLKQQQAAEAQKLAQQMGGPVAAGEFTKALEPYAAAMPAEAGSTILHGLGMAQSGEQEAERFAGQVFPALRTEQTARSDSFFRDQIKTLQNQIAQNRAGKSALTNSKLTDLVNNERNFHLSVMQAAEQKLKDRRDWQATKQQLHNDSVRLSLSQKASRLSEAGVTGRYKGRPTLEAKRLSQQQRMEAQRLGLSAAEFKARLAHSTESSQQSQQRLSVEATKNAMSVLDSAYDPTNGKPITMTTKMYIPKGGAAEFRASSGKISDAHYDPKRHQWYQYQRLTLSARDWAKRGGYTGPTPITNPDRLYDLLRGAVPQLSRKAAINMIRAKTGMNDWSPGAKHSYSGSDLQQLSLDELIGIAQDRGFTGLRHGRVRKQQLVDYILHHQAG